MKFGVVNKSTMLNRFVLHTLQRNITHLAVKTRKTNIKLGILKGGNWKRAKKSNSQTSQQKKKNKLSYCSSFQNMGKTYQKCNWHKLFVKLEKLYWHVIFSQTSIIQVFFEKQASFLSFPAFIDSFPSVFYFTVF